VAREGDTIRAFEEFGTGEQQILLMAFMRAYATTFKGETYILGIEEPEAHLHPLAQRWLMHNVNAICKAGIQVILTTHSPEFLDIENLEGFVRVYKDGAITKVVQNNAAALSESCISLASNPRKTSAASILEFYKTNTFADQVRGFFARKIMLVEGATEYFALPEYFSSAGIDLVRSGIEVVDCRGKSQLCRNYRLFKAYGYDCFCLFDADDQETSNEDLAATFGFDHKSMKRDQKDFVMDRAKGYGYFGDKFETYMRATFKEYSAVENSIDGSKVLKARQAARSKSFHPTFIAQISESLAISVST
jgi:putative ATP-dependent endonuclease of OLD family